MDIGRKCTNRWVYEEKRKSGWKERRKEGLVVLVRMAGLLYLLVCADFFFLASAGGWCSAPEKTRLSLACLALPCNPLPKPTGGVAVCTTNHSHFLCYDAQPIRNVDWQYCGSSGRHDRMLFDSLTFNGTHLTPPYKYHVLLIQVCHA